METDEPGVAVDGSDWYYRPEPDPDGSQRRVPLVVAEHPQHHGTEEHVPAHHDDERSPVGGIGLGVATSQRHVEQEAKHQLESTAGEAQVQPNHAERGECNAVEAGSQHLPRGLAGLEFRIRSRSYRSAVPEK